MFKRVLLVLLLAAFSGVANADVLKNEKEMRKLSNSIMDKVAKGEFMKAFEAMKPYVIIPEAEFQSAALNSKAQRDQYASRFGASYDYEFISKKKVGKSLVRLQYIEKTENHALPWTFYYYKNKEGWVLNSFNWNDQFPQLFMLN